MKAIVLAGGHATRLWPLTRDRAKPLLPLAGKPIASYVMDQLRAMDGVDEVLISTNAKFADDFRDFIAEHGYDAEVVVEDHETEAGKIGSLGAIIQVIDEYGDDDYLVVGGDNYTSLDLAGFVEEAAGNGGPTIACYEVDDLADASAFGVVDVDGNGRITDFVEKPAEPPSRLVSTLFYYFPRNSMGMFDDYMDAHRDSDADHLDEPGRLIEWAHSRMDWYAHGFDGAWYDIGTPANYLAAQDALGETRVDGEVTDSDLGANVWVMDGAEVESATLEDCIVFPEAHIQDADLRGTIVDAEAVVDGVDLEDSVVGAFSTLR